MGDFFRQETHYFSEDFHTFENVAQWSHIAFATSLASKEYSLIRFRGLAEVAHENQDICETIAWCCYLVCTCIMDLEYLLTYSNNC